MLGKLARAVPAARRRGQWRNGAMGNAKWTGVRLRDVLDRAGVKPGSVAVRLTASTSRSLTARPTSPSRSPSITRATVR